MSTPPAHAGKAAENARANATATRARERRGSSIRLPAAGAPARGGKKTPPWQTPRRPGTGLARALSKLGYCSRSEAFSLIRQGKVKVNRLPRRDPAWPVDLRRDRLEVDQQRVTAAARVYLMLNKPRGLVTTASDEHGRPTVFQCLKGAGLPFVSPVGRLDQASEGLLLFSNDTSWGARITNPAARLEKVYHVQIDRVADETLLRAIRQGTGSEGDFLGVARAAILRTGERNSWLEIVLLEGKNRHIRRLLAALGANVLRLVRVAIGTVHLENLPKGSFRHLADWEMRALGGQVPRSARPRH